MTKVETNNYDNSQTNVSIYGKLSKVNKWKINPETNNYDNSQTNVSIYGKLSKVNKWKINTVLP